MQYTKAVSDFIIKPKDEAENLNLNVPLLVTGKRLLFIINENGERSLAEEKQNYLENKVKAV